VWAGTFLGKSPDFSKKNAPMPLTDTAVKSAKPADKPVRLFDGGGMSLEVSPSGGKL
jgi:hypothetical protein